MTPTHLNIRSASEADTANFAARIAPLLSAGDTLLLEGPIGAGKSAFARALIRARLGRQEDVPSPTFTIVQTYQDGDVEIWHCDLYRLTHPDEAFELGLIDAMETGICLIEWPDRLGTDRPENALTLVFSAQENDHQITANLSEYWANKLGNTDV